MPIINQERKLFTLDRAALLLLALTPLVVNPWLSDPFGLPQRVVFHFGVALLCLVSFVRNLNRPIALPRWLCLFGTMALLGIAVSTIQSRNPWEVLPQAGTWILLFPWLGLLRPTSLEKRGVRNLLLVGVLQVILGVMEISFLPGPFRVESFPTRFKFFGTLGNPQYVAIFLGMLSFFLIYPGALLLSRRVRLFLGIAFTVGFLIAGSQTVALALFGTVLVMGILTRRRSVLWVSLFALVALLVFFYPHSHTIRGRWLINQIAWKVGGEAFGMGVGLDHFQHYFLETQRALFNSGAFDAFKQNAAFTRRAHNEYLDFYVEGGILLFSAFLILLVVLAKGIWRTRQTPNANSAIVLFTLLVSWAAFPFHIIATLLVFAVAALSLLETGPQRTISIPREAIALPFAIFVGVLLTQDATSVLASFHGSRAHDFAVNGKVEAAKGEALRALHADPESLEWKLLLARLNYRLFLPEKSLALLDEMDALETSVDSLKLRGVILIDRKEYAAAQRVYRILNEAIPWQITSPYHLGEIYLAQGFREEAKKEFQEALRRRPTNLKAILDQATAEKRIAQLEITVPVPRMLGPVHSPD